MERYYRPQLIPSLLPVVIVVALLFLETRPIFWEREMGIPASPLSDLSLFQHFLHLVWLPALRSACLLQVLARKLGAIGKAYGYRPARPNLDKIRHNSPPEFYYRTLWAILLLWKF